MSNQVVSVAPKRFFPEVVPTSAKRAKSDGDDDAPVMPAFTTADGSPGPCGSFCASLCGSDDERDATYTHTPVMPAFKPGECPMPEPKVDASLPMKLITYFEEDSPGPVLPMVRTYSQSLTADADVLPEAQDEEVRGILARISAEHKAVKAETLATGRSDEEHLLAIQGLSKPTPADIAFEDQIGDLMRGIAAEHADGPGPAPSMEALQSLSRENLKTIADMVVEHLEQHPTSIFSTAARALEDGPAKKASSERHKSPPSPKRVVEPEKSEWIEHQKGPRSPWTGLN